MVIIHSVGRKEDKLGGFMTTPVRRLMESVAVRSEGKRKERSKKWEDQTSSTWEKLIEDKKQEAGDLPLRFTFMYPMAEDRSYYTLAEDNDTKLVFMDINRDQNTGVRQCVVLHDAAVTLLATVKPVGWDVRDKHRWQVVSDSTLRRIHIESIYDSLKNAPVFDPWGQLSWKGLYPDTTEVLKILCSEDKME